MHAEVTPEINLVLAQLNFFVGDIDGNANKIIDAVKAVSEKHSADCLVCPELALTGYPPEDLLLRDDFHQRVTAALVRIQQAVDETEITCIVGAPYRDAVKINNAAIVCQPGKPQIIYAKRHLPNYGVFDEKRYFTEGNEPIVLQCAGAKLGLLICEDCWHEAPARDLKELGADAIITINASPFDMHKASKRQELLYARANECQLPFIYVHCVGGQDEVVFDGGSMAVNRQGELMVTGLYFEEQLLPVTLQKQSNEYYDVVKQTQPLSVIEPLQQIYSALVLGVRDYVAKNGFNQVIIGSSGGVDSALTAAIAVDAVGAENVLAVFMPSRYTSALSQSCHQALCAELKIASHSIPIENCFQAFKNSLNHYITEDEASITQQNIQARIRGVMLMAFSNDQHRMVLTTGNKSEIAVGYATLYGDMAGGFAVLKDVPKTLVYQLCEYRNTQSPAIPEAIIHRAPTAELAAGQKDTDSLPPYDVLDAILEDYVEHDKSPEDIVAKGFSESDVVRVIKMVKCNEYKRRQAPPGVRITSRAFGRERRYPISNGF